MNIFLDSGAFSADSKGKPIDIMDYIRYIQENKKFLTVWANLDVIGDAEASWENQRIMEDHGVGGLPVYHIEDDIKYLYKCMDYEYFALGGIAGQGSSEVRRLHFLDMCFDIICDKDGYPRNKVHGFGLASPHLVQRYPFYSFDSSSWVYYGKFGMVIVPKRVNGEFLYDRPPVKVFVSTRSSKKGEDGVHFLSMSKMEQNSFIDYIESKNIKLGKSSFLSVESTYKLTHNEIYVNKSKTEIERKEEIGACNDHLSRDFLNYCYYKDLVKGIGEYPTRFNRKTFDDLF